MRWFLRGSILSCYLGGLLTVAGCSEDNDKASGIKGDGKVQAPINYADQSKATGKTGGPAGYPGTPTSKKK